MTVAFALDEDARQLRAAWIAAGIPPLETLTPDRARAMLRAFRSAPGPREPVATVVDLKTVAGDTTIPLRLYHPGTAGETLPCLVFLHGGGWVFNDLEPHDPLCRAIANRSGCAVVAVDYRLAPEWPYPAALNDAVAALRHVRRTAADLRIDPEQLAVGGDSAGGNLAAVLALIGRDEGWRWLRGQLLFYPVLDLTLERPSQAIAGEGLALTGASMRWFRDLYLLNDMASTRSWRASPLHAASLAGVARCAIVTAGCDPLRDEGVDYAARLAGDGIRVLHDHYPGQMHGFVSAGLALPTANSALDVATRWLARTLGQGDAA